MSETNGSSTAFTVKEMLVKLDEGQQEILEQLKVVSDRQIAHENQPGHANNHENRLSIVEKWQNTRQGNIDVLKFFFGASAFATVMSVITLIQMLSGGTKP
jgi:hypothetical protein